MAIKMVSCLLCVLALLATLYLSVEAVGDLGKSAMLYRTRFETPWMLSSETETHSWFVQDPFHVAACIETAMNYNS